MFLYSLVSCKGIVSGRAAEDGSVLNERGGVSTYPFGGGLGGHPGGGGGGKELRRRERSPKEGWRGDESKRCRYQNDPPGTRWATRPAGPNRKKSRMMTAKRGLAP
jgi:hypothetical protein